MLNKDISSAARFSLLAILFLSGANGLMVEIHPNPAGDLTELQARLRGLLGGLGRQMVQSW